jgi:hypothetical protein
MYSYKGSLGATLTLGAYPEKGVEFALPSLISVFLCSEAKYGQFFLAIIMGRHQLSAGDRRHIALLVSAQVASFSGSIGHY